MKGGKRNMKKLFGMFILASVLLTIGFASAVDFVSDANTQYWDGANWQNSVAVSSIPGEWVAITGGTWVWNADPIPAELQTSGETVTFRKTFELEPCEEGNYVGTIDISADNDFALSLNGNPIGQESTGSVFGNKYTYDISPYLQEGNTLTIVADNWPWNSANPAGIIFVGSATCQPTPSVPEFGGLVAGLTIVGALGVFFVVRRK
jgi:hypothetical protein